MKLTQTNLSALKQWMNGQDMAPARVEAVLASHLKRCLAAGLIVVDGAVIRLTPAGKSALEAR